MTTTAAYRAKQRTERRVSPKQRMVFAWIRDYLARHGAAPSSGEVREGVGLGKTAWQEHLLALERAGLIRRRSIEVVAPGGGGLTAAEAAWCQANPARVRAMMAVTGSSPSRAVTGDVPSHAVAGEGP